MTVYDILQKIRAAVEEMDAALGIDPRNRTPTPERLARSVKVKAEPAGKRKAGSVELAMGKLYGPLPKRKRGRPKGSKNKPKEA